MGLVLCVDALVVVGGAVEYIICNSCGHSMPKDTADVKKIKSGHRYTCGACKLLIKGRVEKEKQSRGRKPKPKVESHEDPNYEDREYIRQNIGL